MCIELKRNEEEVEKDGSNAEHHHHLIITIIMIIVDIIMIMIIVIRMEDDGEELVSNAEQVDGRGFLDGSSHCQLVRVPNPLLIQVSWGT